MESCNIWDCCLKLNHLPYLYGYEEPGVYETVTWNDGDESEENISIILQEPHSAWIDHIVEYESSPLPQLFFPITPVK